MWEAWQKVDTATQAAVIAVIARTIVQIMRRFGLECRPGFESVLAAAGLGAIAGYATSGWPGALLGGIAGLAGTGLWEAQVQAARYGEDRVLMLADREDAQEGF